KSSRKNEPIYERPVVKRGGADFVSQGSRTSSSPSASVDLAHLRPIRGRFRCASRDTSSEPEAEGEFPPLSAGSVRCVDRRDSRNHLFGDTRIAPMSPLSRNTKDASIQFRDSRRWGRCLA